MFKNIKTKNVGTQKTRQKHYSIAIVASAITKLMSCVKIYKKWYKNGQSFATYIIFL